ncbi:MAG: hypothetical protein IJZ19_12665 [Lentisphaeria bacterium]|nr:hypothetical protein [Lentisphaeria bacterium]
MNFSLSLNGEWFLTGKRQTPEVSAGEFITEAELEMPAAVPGNIEDALCRQGIVQDPFFGTNSRQLRKYEFYEWCYTREFQYDGVPRELELQADGIDCLAVIYLNGKEIGRAENALIGHKFPLQLVKGKNRISIRLRSPNLEMEKFPMSANAIAGAVCYNAEHLWIRRPAHEWGWDIAPRMALGGIFRDIRIVEVPRYRFEEEYLQTAEIKDQQAFLIYQYKVAAPEIGEPELMLELHGQCGDSVFSAKRILWSLHGTLSFYVDDPKLWWPRNYGEANLYHVTAVLKKDGQILAESHFEFGIRTVRLHNTNLITEQPEPDFQFYVNEKPIRVVGVNHVPADALHSRDVQKLPVLLDEMKELGINMVRVWGGGIYEPDSFYSFCDRCGIMVWQDFMMACGQYPNDTIFCDRIKEEAEWVVKQLRKHPSVILYCGDNECDFMFCVTKRKPEPEKNLLTRQILPEVCRLHDPLNIYLASSPYLDPKLLPQVARCTGDPMLLTPEQHIWGDRSHLQSPYYYDSKASFISETGFFGMPPLHTLAQFLSEVRLPDETPEWCFHATNANYPYDMGNNYRIGILYAQIEAFFGKFDGSIEDFVLASQILQAEGEKFQIENFRSKPKCSGIILWNLADCWPQPSEALLDYYGNRKMAWYFVRRSMKPVLIMPAMGKFITAVNDSAEDVCGTWTLESLSAGEICSAPFELPAGTCKTLFTFPQPEKQDLFLIRWTLQNGEQGVNHHICGKPLFDLAVFREKYLPAIAGLDNSFDPETIWR